jgi:hypothetical protein
MLHLRRLHRLVRGTRVLGQAPRCRRPHAHVVAELLRDAIGPLAREYERVAYGERSQDRARATPLRRRR